MGSPVACKVLPTSNLKLETSPSGSDDDQREWATKNISGQCHLTWQPFSGSWCCQWCTWHPRYCCSSNSEAWGSEVKCCAHPVHWKCKKCRGFLKYCCCPSTWQSVQSSLSDHSDAETVPPSMSPMIIQVIFMKHHQCVQGEFKSLWQLLRSHCIIWFGNSCRTYWYGFLAV
jgi:hypothetical protein